jgi:hypothetical protein
MLMGLVFSFALLGLGISGCGEEPGTAEKAGKEIDQAMEKAGNAMSEAKEEVMEEAEEMAHSEEDEH